MRRPERALVLLKPQFLGDAVMGCPLIDSVAATYAETVVMCGPVVQELLADRRAIVQFATGSKISGVAAVLRAARHLRKLEIDHAYIVNRSFRSALAVRLAGIKARVGHPTEGRSWLLTHRVPYDDAKFEAECYLDLAKQMDLPLADPHPRLSAPPCPLTFDLPAEAIGLQPGARYPEKQVPLRILAEVGQQLADAGRPLALLGGKDEVGQSSEFMALLDRPCQNLVGRLGLPESMAALSKLRLMVGSDTGLMHVAAALGTPTVTVFGPNPASKWGHNYVPHRIIEAPGQIMSRVQSDMLAHVVLEAIGEPNTAS